MATKIQSPNKLCKIHQSGTLLGLFHFVATWTIESFPCSRYKTRTKWNSTSPKHSLSMTFLSYLVENVSLYLSLSLPLFRSKWCSSSWLRNIWRKSNKQAWLVLSSFVFLFILLRYFVFELCTGPSDPIAGWSDKTDLKSYQFSIQWLWPTFFDIQTITKLKQIEKRMMRKKPFPIFPELDFE